MIVLESCRMEKLFRCHVLRQSRFALCLFLVRALKVGIVTIASLFHELYAVVNDLEGSFLADGEL